MSVVAPLLSYSFQRDKCLENVFFYEGSGVVGSINNALTLSGCLNGDGISSVTKFSSFRTVSTMKTLLGTKDFAIEMWIRPKLNVTVDTTMFAIGIDSTTSSKCKNNLAVR